MSYYRIDNHIKSKIISLREENVSVTDIADELGVTVSMFSFILYN